MRISAFILASFLTNISVDADAEVASHCSDTEKVIWSCRAGAKLYSLCASSDLDRSGGYLQYRAGRPNAVEMRFPAIAKPPGQAFNFDLLAHGTSLSFVNGQYTYEIDEDIKGETGILVTGSGKSATIRCSDSTASLTLTTTMKFFESIGVGPRHGQ